MFKKISLIIIIMIAISGLGYGGWIYRLISPDRINITKQVFNPDNATYVIDGDSITLINGKAEKEILPGSASKIEVMAWGEPALGDLNFDQANDAALILTYSAGGSGTFYYVVAALQDTETMGTNAILLGDRIAPQNISVDNGKIVVNYADRKAEEPMSVPPSMGITRTFEVQGATLVEVVFCTQEQRKAEVCFQIYEPICAKVNIQCIKAPCDPIYQTFSNSCEACKNPLAESYTKNECISR